MINCKIPIPVLELNIIRQKCILKSFYDSNQGTSKPKVYTFRLEPSNCFDNLLTDVISKVAPAIISKRLKNINLYIKLACLIRYSDNLCQPCLIWFFAVKACVPCNSWELLVVVTYFLHMATCFKMVINQIAFRGTEKSTFGLQHMLSL